MKFTFLDLTVVETIHEVSTPDWIYRFISSSDMGACIVKRLPVDRKDFGWHHGVIVQTVSKEEKKFLPANVCGWQHRFEHLPEAIDFVNSYVE